MLANLKVIKNPSTDTCEVQASKSYKNINIYRQDGNTISQTYDKSGNEGYC
jgi:hypothetical protein